MVRTSRPNQKRGDVPNKDTFSRINFLYQAVHLILQQNPGNTGLIRFYCHSVKSIAKKQVLRLHPDIKRTICKKCWMLLVPGVSATVRKKGKKQQHIVIKCLECQTPKRFPVNCGYRLWGLQPSAWVSFHPATSSTPSYLASPVGTASSHSDEKDALSPKVEDRAKCRHKRCRRRSHCFKLDKKCDTSDETSKTSTEASLTNCDKLGHNSSNSDKTLEVQVLPTDTAESDLPKAEKSALSNVEKSGVSNSNVHEVSKIGNGHEVSVMLEPNVLGRVLCKNEHVKGTKEENSCDNPQDSTQKNWIDFQESTESLEIKLQECHARGPSHESSNQETDKRSTSLDTEPNIKHSNDETEGVTNLQGMMNGPANNNETSTKDNLVSLKRQYPDSGLEGVTVKQAKLDDF